MKERGAGIKAKSGIMLGLGEQDDEVMQTLRDLVAHGCALLTIGQYLRPTPNHLPVIEYVHPDKFRWWAEQAEAIGFESVASGPLVRSSFHADELAGTVRPGRAARSRVGFRVAASYAPGSAEGMPHLSLSKTQIDRLGDRLRGGGMTETDLRLLDSYRRSFFPAYERVVGAIRSCLASKSRGDRRSRRLRSSRSFGARASG